MSLVSRWDDAWRIILWVRTGKAAKPDLEDVLLETEVRSALHCKFLATILVATRLRAWPRSGGMDAGSEEAAPDGSGWLRHRCCCPRVQKEAAEESASCRVSVGEVDQGTLWPCG